MDSPPVPDELLVDIFLRISEPADLVRASAACVSFRRLVANRSFLRQYRKLHASPLLGFLVGRKDFQPVIAPHPSAPAASAVAVAADFSFSFLPAPASDWLVEDIRDGRVLLGKSRFNKSTVDYKEIVVCDPLHRQYLLLPPIPDELFREVWLARHIFLVPPAGSVDKEETAEETTFRVIWMAVRRDKLVAIVFSSSTGQWQDGPSHSWSNSFDGLLLVPGVINLSRPQYAYGCFYWVVDSREKLLMLDTRKMEFSIADAPPEAKGAHVDIAIVETGEGRPGMFMLSHGTPDLSFNIGRNNIGRSVQWQLEKTISLGFWYGFAGSMGRQLFLRNKGNYFSLDIKTFQLVKVCTYKNKHGLFLPRPYSNFPPSLSSPTVATGVETGTEKETLGQGCGASSSAQPPLSG